MSFKGWMKLQRTIQNTEFWKRKPFDDAHALLDLKLNANHERKSVKISDESITVDRGSLLTSQVKLMERFGWSKERLRRFFREAEALEEIRTESVNRKYTVIHILKYDIDSQTSFQTNNQTSFQTNNQTSFQTSEKPYISRESSDSQTRYQTSFQPKNRPDIRPVFRHKQEDIKNIKEYEEEKEETVCQLYGSNKNVKMTETELQEIKSLYSEYLVRTKLEELSQWLDGRTVKKSHSVLLREFCERDKGKTLKKTAPQTDSSYDTVEDFIKKRMEGGDSS